MALTIYCDGLCEPRNPGGYGCWAWIAFDEQGQELESCCGCLGHGPTMTNNIAEYEAVIRALSWATEHGAIGVIVRTDSQLAVNQINGSWRINKPHLASLAEKARPLLTALQGQLEWVPREQNTRADATSHKAYQTALQQR